MKKLIIFTFFIFLLGCKSVDNWNENPVLSQETVNMAQEYVLKQKDFLELISKKKSLEVYDNLSIDELNIQLQIEKDITLASQNVINLWFDFFLLLREDEGFSEAYKGHYYFKKAFETLSFAYKIKRSFVNDTKKDKEYQDKITVIEAECRMAIGEIVSYNDTFIDIDSLYKQLRKIEKSMK